MNRIRARIILGLVTLASGIALLSSGCASEARADPPVRDLYSVAVVCPPFNLFNPDAGAGVNGRLICGEGYRAVRAESESANPIYFCGRTGCTRANHATVGQKRCTTCTYGGAFKVDAYQEAGERCISGTADAGVSIAVQCGK